MYIRKPHNLAHFKSAPVSGIAIRDRCLDPQRGVSLQFVIIAYQRTAHAQT